MFLYFEYLRNNRFSISLLKKGMTRLEEYEMFYTVWLRLHYFGRVLVEGILDKFNADGAPSGFFFGGGGHSLVLSIS